MPEGEEMFKFHGYSGSCPKEPLPRPKTELETLRERLAAIRAAIDEIVVSEGEDAGVILLPSDSPTHFSELAKCRVYDFENFSPLGDALVALAKLAKEKS
jgi:hypothetical protein